MIINGWRPRKIEVFLPPELLAFPGSLPETRNQAYKVIVQTGRETGQNLLQDEMDVTIKPLLTSTMIDKTQVQQRVINSCLEGSSIREINIDGTVFCETDTVGAGGATEVTASAPLVSSGGATPDISLDTTPLQLRVASFCPAGSSIREINIDGTVVCEADDVGVGGGVTAEQFAALASGVANKVDKAGDTMGGDLVVNGIVSADAIVFNAPVASLVSIPAAAFQSLDNTVDTYEMRNNGVGIHQKPGAALFTDLYAPVYLPVGALITGFSASIDDRNLNVGENIEVTLLTQVPSSFSPTLTGLGTVDSDSAQPTVFIDTFSNPNPVTFHYFGSPMVLKVRLNGSSGDPLLTTARVDYTIDAP